MSETATKLPQFNAKLNRNNPEHVALYEGLLQYRVKTGKPDASCADFLLHLWKESNKPGSNVDVDTLKRDKDSVTAEYDILSTEKKQVEESLASANLRIAELEEMVANGTFINEDGTITGPLAEKMKEIQELVEKGMAENQQLASVSLHYTPEHPRAAAFDRIHKVIANRMADKRLNEPTVMDVVYDFYKFIYGIMDPAKMSMHHFIPLQ